MKKGISLIVLSITILVMAILAAAVIISLEDSGIIGRAKNTTNKVNYADEYTRLTVIKNGILTDNLGTITVEEYINELDNKGIIESGRTNNADGSVTVTTKSGYEVTISQSGSSDLSMDFEGVTDSNNGNNNNNQIKEIFAFGQSSYTAEYATILSIPLIVYDDTANFNLGTIAISNIDIATAWFETSEKKIIFEPLMSGTVELSFTVDGQTKTCTVTVNPK